MNRRIRPRPVWCLLLLLLFLPGSMGRTQDRRSAWKDRKLPSETGPVEAVISRQKLGVVGVEGATREQIVSAMAKEELRLDGVLPQEILIFRYRKPQPPADLRAAADRLRKQPLIRKAGLVLRVNEAEHPMLITDELVVRVRGKKPREVLAALKPMLNRKAAIVRTVAYMKDVFLVRLPAGSVLDALQFSDELQADPAVVYAHPDYVMVFEYRATLPDDPLFTDQWHLHNTGGTNKTEDADMDAPQAWDITEGSADVVIAVVDGGSDVEHPDLIDNLWVNPGEIAGDSKDNDCNGYVNDIHGWDFVNNDNVIDNFPHGCSVAGCVAAKGNNSIGVSGSCPQASLMLLQTNFTASVPASCISYATYNGAHVISNSWGFAPGTPTPSVVVDAIERAVSEGGASGHGCVVVFAMPNKNIDACASPPDISALPEVIGVSASDSRDAAVGTGFGNCMDLLAPSRGFGMPGITTTKWTLAGHDYRSNFYGTSASTPLVAGIAGLVLDVRPSMTPKEVQQLLQDTADKIQDSTAYYRELNGFSQPYSGNATHGYGRVNAFEAVRVAAPVTSGGKGGADLILRDNRLDWGNTEQPSNVLMEPSRDFIPHWQSVDIKIDAPPLASPGPATPAEFEAFVDEAPVSDQPHRVYVRIRNRGSVAISNVTVKLHWAFAGTALPALPADFWTSFPSNSSDTTVWHPLAPQTIASLPYSGSSVAGTVADQAVIRAFDWHPPPLDPFEPKPHHYCLWAVARSPQDPVAADSKTSLIVDQITPADNNITQRNVHLLDSTTTTAFVERFYIGNPTAERLRVRLSLNNKPAGSTIRLENAAFDKPLWLAAGEQRLVTMRIQLKREGDEGTVSIRQHQLNQQLAPLRVMGGSDWKCSKSAVAPITTSESDA